MCIRLLARLCIRNNVYTLSETCHTKNIAWKSWKITLFDFGMNMLITFAEHIFTSNKWFHSIAEWHRNAKHIGSSNFIKKWMKKSQKLISISNTIKTLSLILICKIKKIIFSWDSKQFHTLIQCLYVVYKHNTENQKWNKSMVSSNEAVIEILK